MISLDSMIWDLIRLQNLDYYHNDIRCYFILSGFDKKINKLLKNFEICYNKTTNKKNEISKVNSHFGVFDLFKLDAQARINLNEKLESYPNFSLYSKIRFRPAHRFPKKDLINMSFSTYIFEIIKPDKTHKINKL